MNQDQKKYFRERINAIAQSKIVELKREYEELESPDIEKYLSEKNLKPNVKEILKHGIYTSYKGDKYYNHLPVEALFDLAKYNKDRAEIGQSNVNSRQLLSSIQDKIDTDANTVIDAVMFADEAEALKQLKLFTEKEYKL